MKPSRRRFVSWSAVVFAIALVLTTAPAPSSAQGSEPFIGQLALVPYNFAPKGWALCNGQLLSIAQNTALFALIGTTYGGNGTTNFALPDLRGRVPLSSGQGPGLSNYVLGQASGAETQTLTLNQMPTHAHVLIADTSVGTSERPNGALPARNAAGVPQYGTSGTGTMSVAVVQSAGGNQPHDNMQPYLTLNWIIALQGIFPSQN
jgi:microcystin-dependent protein